MRPFGPWPGASEQDVAVRALLDGHVLDLLADDAGALRVVTRALEEGHLELVQTYLLTDELDAMPDRAKWARLRELRARLRGDDVATAGFVLGVSRLDAAQLMGGDDVKQYDRLTGGNVKHAEDALLALTARDKHAVLVTCDKRLTNRARGLGVNVCNPADFVQQLQALLDEQ